MLVSTLVQGHPINRSRTVFPVTGERTQNRKRTGGEDLLKAPQRSTQAQSELPRPPWIPRKEFADTADCFQETGLEGQDGVG
jgi:hypothetical protein